MTPEQRIREWGESPEGDQDVQAYINETPTLMSLLYDLDLMPEQHPDHESRAWEQIFIITNHWREHSITLAAAVREEAIEECAKVAEQQWPRGGAHTYASENADRYIALEDASEHIAERLRALKERKI